MAWSSLTLSYHPSYLPSLLVGPLDCIQCPYKADVYKSLLVSQPWHVHVYQSSRECHLWFYPYFISSVQHVLFFLFGWLMRWVVSGCTAADLLAVASRSCSKQHLAFLHCSHLDFSPCILLVSIWCIHSVVLTQKKIERNPILFYQRDQISIWLIISELMFMPLLYVSWRCFQ